MQGIRPRLHLASLGTEASTLQETRRQLACTASPLPEASSMGRARVILVRLLGLQVLQHNSPHTVSRLQEASSMARVRVILMPLLGPQVLQHLMHRRCSLDMASLGTDSRAVSKCSTTSRKVLRGVHPGLQQELEVCSSNSSSNSMGHLEQ